MMYLVIHILHLVYAPSSKVNGQVQDILAPVGIFRVHIKYLEWHHYFAGVNNLIAY